MLLVIHLLHLLPPIRILSAPTMRQFPPFSTYPADDTSARLTLSSHPTQPRRLGIILMLAGAPHLARCRRLTPGYRCLSDVIAAFPPLATLLLLRLPRLAANHVVPSPQSPRFPEPLRLLWFLPPTTHWLRWLRIPLRVYGPLRRLP